MQKSMKIRVGISACLLGEPVRYDGGHKRNETLMAAFSGVVEWVPVCPESECGLSIPREKMRLVGDPSTPRLIVIETNKDETDRLLAWAGKKLEELADLGIRGFVFKARSPSCGVRDTNIFDEEGKVIFDCSAGLFARAFFDSFPHLPFEDEGRLQDEDCRDRFIRRIR
jgi:uncharacterized protein YbbK (DUF523 family)